MRAPRNWKAFSTREHGETGRNNCRIIIPFFSHLRISIGIIGRRLNPFEILPRLFSSLPPLSFPLFFPSLLSRSASTLVAAPHSIRLPTHQIPCFSRLMAARLCPPRLDFKICAYSFFSFFLLFLLAVSSRATGIMALMTIGKRIWIVDDNNGCDRW